MITIRKIFLFVVLILFFACSEEKKMIEKGNLIVSKIENPKPSPSPSFCRISEFGSINRREFATPIVAKRQNIASKTNVSKRWELQIPDFFSAKLQIRLNSIPAVASEQSSSAEIRRNKYTTPKN